MNKLILPGIILLVSTPCYAQPSFKDSQSATMDAIWDILAKPETARFKFFPLVYSSFSDGEKTTTGWFVCGQVNSKNDYDAYTGFKPFHALIENKKDEFGLEKTYSHINYYSKFCNTIMANAEKIIIEDQNIGGENHSKQYELPEGYEHKEGAIKNNLQKNVENTENTQTNTKPD